MTDAVDNGGKYTLKLAHIIYVIVAMVDVIAVVFIIMYLIPSGSNVVAVGNGWEQVTANKPFTVGNSLYVTFIGIEGCKYCAAERYALFDALSNFGNWTYSGKIVTLGELNYSNYSANPGPNTLFYQANEGGWTINLLDKNLAYSSNYISFSSAETLDNANNPLQTLNAIQTSYIQKYDPSDSVPFTVIGGNFFEIGAGGSMAPNGVPITLSSGGTLTAANMIDEFNIEGSFINSAINTEADYISAFICHDISNSAPVCSTASVRSLENNIK